MISKQLILGVCVVLMSINSASARSWRGIEPLHSTRADVQRLFGPPIDDKSPYMWIYDFPEERAMIYFASGEPCEEGLSEGWKVPKDTVTEIYVTPSHYPKLSEVLTPGKEYTKIQAAHTPGIFYYFDSEEGIRVSSSNGVVHALTYGPAAKDARLSCGEYKYAGPVPPGVKLASVEHYPFDTFGNIRLYDAHARLDNFVIQLFQLREQEPKWRGYIIYYAGRRSYRGEAQFKAKCYKDYLVRVRKMDPASLFAVDGGFREDMQVQLYLGRSDYYPPVLMPTVSPKKVKIIPRRLRSCAERIP